MNVAPDRGAAGVIGFVDAGAKAPSYSGRVWRLTAAEMPVNPAVVHAIPNPRPALLNSKEYSHEDGP